VLTVPESRVDEIVCLSTEQAGIEHLLSREWLLTNERGSYAASSVAGCNTSGYHGLLIGSLNPPVNRIMALSNCLEMVVCEGKVFQLSTFDFGDKLSPNGFRYLRRFRRDTGVHFEYELGPIQLTKAIYLVRNSDTVLLEYAFEGIERPVDFIVRPFVGLRDFHHLQGSHASLAGEVIDEGLLVRHDAPNSYELLMDCPDTRFEHDPQWWFNFNYRINQQRGQDAREDLWTPGFFKTSLEQDGRIVFRAHFGPAGRRGWLGAIDLDAVKTDLARRQAEILDQASAEDKTEMTLALAADQFVVTRRDRDTERSTIVAGYPWFADWGRDAFIALPGLLLATGRYSEAKSVLCTFAAAADQGMIPNRFDDRRAVVHFNSVDASLWFVNAAFQYLEATGDRTTFTQELLPAIREIVEAYHNGTRFGIHADADGLILAGDEQTQLTWMDARFDGITFTPRWGKTVEVNALWHNALCCLHEFCLRANQMAAAERYATMAQQVGASFCEVFWNDELGYLNDIIRPDGAVDTSLRPNQIFAVSLPYGPPLKRSQQKAIVNIVEKVLLTPHGLRTLDRRDEAYQGRYEGPQRQRDGAYHQGTVWPYLMGPFIEAYLKVRNYSQASKKNAAEMIGPLLRHLTTEGCLGSVSEIFDGDDPQRPAGCPAQAWSVGELLRVYKLLQNGKS